ncbi:MFS transporter [Sulfitobacter aestuariivivens]|uniref:MFS transporter n=1 Tax=Sulfitobacter aestuariivivens TaxID=2766981 RepID=UPI003612E585
MSATVLIRGNRNFRLILSASAASNLGDGIALVAVPWLATLLTRDPLLISLVATAASLPWLLFALPAGVWIDNGDRRQLMLRADIARIGLTLCIVGLIFSAHPLGEGHSAMPIIALALIAFLVGCAEVIRDNAAQTILPALVKTDQLEQANGQIWSAEQVMGQFIGPPLAGVLIAAGVVLPFGVNGFAFAMSALLIWLIVLPPRAQTVKQTFGPPLSKVLHGCAVVALSCSWR